MWHVLGVPVEKVSVAPSITRPLNNSQGTYPSCACCYHFGPEWVGKVVQFKVDNAPFVQVIEATYVCKSLT